MFLLCMFGFFVRCVPVAVAAPLPLPLPLPLTHIHKLKQHTLTRTLTQKYYYKHATTLGTWKQHSAPLFGLSASHSHPSFNSSFSSIFRAHVRHFKSSKSSSFIDSFSTSSRFIGLFFIVAACSLGVFAVVDAVVFGGSRLPPPGREPPAAAAAAAVLTESYPSWVSVDVQPLYAALLQLQQAITQNNINTHSHQPTKIPIDNTHTQLVSSLHTLLTSLEAGTCVEFLSGVCPPSLWLHPLLHVLCAPEHAHTLQHKYAAACLQHIIKHHCLYVLLFPLVGSELLVSVCHYSDFNWHALHQTNKQLNEWNQNNYTINHEKATPSNIKYRHIDPSAEEKALINLLLSMPSLAPAAQPSSAANHSSSSDSTSLSSLADEDIAFMQRVASRWEVSDCSTGSSPYLMSRIVRSLLSQFTYSYDLGVKRAAVAQVKQQQQVYYHAVRALATLAQHPQAAQYIIQANGMKLLFQLFEKYQFEIRMKIQVARALANLLSHPLSDIRSTPLPSFPHSHPALTLCSSGFLPYLVSWCHADLADPSPSAANSSTSSSTSSQHNHHASHKHHTLPTVLSHHTYTHAHGGEMTSSESIMSLRNKLQAQSQRCLANLQAHVMHANLLENATLVQQPLAFQQSLYADEVYLFHPFCTRLFQADGVSVDAAVSSSQVDIVFLHGLLGNPLRTWRLHTQHDRTMGIIANADNRAHAQQRDNATNDTLVNIVRSGPLPQTGSTVTAQPGQLPSDTLALDDWSMHSHHHTDINQLQDADADADAEHAGSMTESVDASADSLALSTGVTPVSSVSLSTSPEYESLWPRDWLPQAVPNARIISLGYSTALSLKSPSVEHSNSLSASPSSSSSSRSSVSFSISQPLSERSVELTERLRAARVGQDGRGIIWVTHSMGGLLAKQIIVQAAHSKTARFLCDSSVGIVFYSTPHFGTWIPSASNHSLVSYVYIPSHEIKELQNVAKLTNLNTQFMQFTHIQSLSLGEGVGTPLVTTNQAAQKMLNYKLVPPSSSNPGFGSFLYFPDQNHLNICKPKTENDENYHAVRAFISQIVQQFEKNKTMNS